MPKTQHRHDDIPGIATRAMRQRTLKTAISCSGIALHSGSRVAMTLRPAEPDTGIVFHRVDIAGGGALIPARWDRVADTRLCTAIANEAGVKVATIEHLMAALAGCGIDNALIDINGPEVPVMDGSSAPFVFLIECAGVVEQDAPRRAIKIVKPVSASESGKVATLLPASEFSIQFEIQFDSAVIARQEMFVAFDGEAFKHEIARARTFGFEHEVSAMRAAGLARGGSLDNAVVISGDRVLNEGGLRYDDEFVRHKVLDSVGDLYLAGAPILGHFRGVRSGHALNNALLRALFADPTAWRWTTLEAGARDAAPAATWPAAAVAMPS